MFIPTNLQMSSHPTLKIGAKKINSIYKQNLLGCAPKSSMEIHMIHIENSFGQLFMIPFIPFAPRITFFQALVSYTASFAPPHWQHQGDIIK